MRLGAAAWIVVLSVSLVAVPGASAHGSGADQYRTTIDRIEPADVPVKVVVEAGDRLRIENVGDKTLLLCGYDTEKCEPYARIGPEGVFVNTSSPSYYANLDLEEYGDVPEDAGSSKPAWKRLRRSPPFFAYHDHRAHWMGGKRPPANVDTSDPRVQKVNDFTINFEYGGKPGSVEGRLEYVGGQRWYTRYFEVILAGIAIGAMVAMFVLDSRRRRRDRSVSSNGSSEATS
jgi:hypothetical protein